jgi:rare lipoprotein A (peptidoglycan hydrolase)
MRNSVRNQLGKCVFAFAVLFLMPSFSMAKGKVPGRKIASCSLAPCEASVKTLQQTLDEAAKTGSVKSADLDPSIDAVERDIASNNPDFEEVYVPDKDLRADESMPAPEPKLIQASLTKEEPIGCMPRKTQTCTPYKTFRPRPEATYYASSFNGNKLDSGVTFQNKCYYAAHLSLPIGTVVEVKNPATGGFVYVTVVDRGPYKCSKSKKSGKMVCNPHPTREIDLSQKAFTALFATTDKGKGQIELSVCN